MKAALAVLLTVGGAATVPAQGSYTITHTYPLGGNGSWDYPVPDPAEPRVYIGRSDRVMDSSVVMFDPKTLEPLGRIHAAEDADAVIYDPASNRVFTFNGNAHSSTVIDPVAVRRCARLIVVMVVERK